MKTSRFWGYFAKLGLGAGVAFALGAAPVVAHAEDNTPSGAMDRGSQAAGNAADTAGNAASGAANQAGNAASGAADQAGNAASSAANKASDEASSAANKASDTANSAADRANNAADRANNAATGANEQTGAASDDSAITDAVKTKLKGSDTSDIKVDTDNGVVTLSGTVHQQSAREHAVKMAKKAKGVKKVKDDIEVVPAATK